MMTNMICKLYLKGNNWVSWDTKDLAGRRN